MKFNIPKRFKVGGIDYTVNMVEHIGTSDDFGVHYCDGQIDIATQTSGRQTSDSLRRQTFFHELTHAILSCMNKTELNRDESFVNTFSSFLSQAIDSMEGEL